MISPLGRIRIAKRAALRRRYGYAALRILRRGIRRAIAAHYDRQVGPGLYSITAEQIGEAYAEALRALRKRWPRLDLADPRGELER